MAVTFATRSRFRSSVLAVGAVCIAFALQAATAQAERPVALNELQKQVDREGKPNQQFEQEEASSLKFVKEHHGELASLLAVLKQRNPAQYKAALRDLNRTRVRLEQLRGRSEDRYEIELETWKLKSRIQLLTARLQMGDSPALRKELLAALAEQAKLRLASLKLERERLAERLAKVDEQIERHGSNAQSAAEQQLKMLLNKLDETRQAKSKSNASREAPKTKPTRNKETNPKSRASG